MRHRKKTLKLGKKTGHRKSMLAGMTSSLILKETITTTLAKAKACKARADKVISLSKEDSQHSRNKVMKLVRDKLALDKTFEVLGDRYRDRDGGFVRIVKTGYRKGDDARMARLILVGTNPIEKKTERSQSSKEKKEDKKQTDKSKKKGILDKVKSFGSGGKGKVTRGGQTDTKANNVKAKSRSGI